jgi:hypothetical protein
MSLSLHPPFFHYAFVDKPASSAAVDQPGVMPPNGLETRGNILEFMFHSILTTELK